MRVKLRLMKKMKTNKQKNIKNVRKLIKKNEEMERKHAEFTPQERAKIREKLGL